ncbi:MAG: Undecaprenyl phosphate-alpha-4-amino-4-deoxy-L-arabinose arabinosyl transferase [bacterium ADurb.Bin363]|nr:MAG: Undecaprenyl phosphate-alpha-4-amino-4-deoxy-L-arabinose arabinosyl transferase [bacterium ADurb.Bin363]
MINNLKKNEELLLLLFTSSLLLLINIGNIKEFFCDDEYLYIKIAGEMFQKKVLFIPVWFEEAAYFKPPFTYWLMMMFFPFGGVNITTGRFSIAFISVFTIYFIYLLGKRLYGREEGYLAGLLTCTSFGYLIYGRVGMMDMPLTFFMTLSIYSFYRAFQEKSSFYGALFFALTGASCLVKGPISIIILLSIAIIFLSFFGGWRIFFNIRSIAGILVGIFLVLLWPLSIYCSGDWTNWYNFFILRENMGKFSDSTHYTILSLLPYYLQFFFPWSLIFLGIFPLIFLKKYFRRSEYAIPLLWFFCSTLIFLLPETKLKHYTIPALPALSLMVSAIWHKVKNHPLLKISLYITSIVFLLLFFILSGLIRLTFTFPPFIFLSMALFITLIIIVFLIKGKLIHTIYGFSIWVILLILAGPYFTFESFPEEAISLIGNSSLGVVKKQIYLHSYFLNRPVRQISSREETVEILEKNGKIIISKGDLDTFQKDSLLPSFRIIYSWEQWKGGFSPEEIFYSLSYSDISGLKEPVYIIQKEGSN